MSGKCNYIFNILKKEKETHHHGINNFLFHQVLTLSESVGSSCNVKLSSSLLGPLEHPLDVLWIVSI